MDVTDAEPPQSVFNKWSSKLISFLENELKQHRNPEIESNPASKLHLHQIEAALQLRKYFNAQKGDSQLGAAGDPKSIDANRRIALVVLPTGCGKTGVAVLASYVLSASRVLVITPSAVISKQVQSAYRKFLIECGVIKEESIRTAQCNVLPECPLIKMTGEILEHLSAPVMAVNVHKIGGRSNIKITDIPFNAYDLVIVDEAHHYPAKTWEDIVDYFYRSKRLFLTATPEHHGKPILPETPPCYELKKEEAVRRGIIRAIHFNELTEGDEDYQKFHSIMICMEKHLNKHDQLEPTVKHQGMVLAQTKYRINPATTFCEKYNQLYPGNCAVYVTGSPKSVLDDYKEGKIRTLVVIGRLLEGFDHKKVSVVGIMRNVAPTSRVLFAQFIGRAVRKTHQNDRVEAWVVSHECFGQQKNFDTFDKLDPDEVDPDDGWMDGWT